MQKSIFLEGTLKISACENKNIFACRALNSPTCKNTPQRFPLPFFNLHTSLAHKFFLDLSLLTPPLRRQQWRWWAMAVAVGVGWGGGWRRRAITWIRWWPPSHRATAADPAIGRRGGHCPRGSDSGRPPHMPWWRIWWWGMRRGGSSGGGEARRPSPAQIRRW